MVRYKRIKTQTTLNKIQLVCSVMVRDRPFNLQGRGGGGDYDFLFRSEFFFRTTQELEYFFFQNLTLDYVTKTLNQIFFFHQNQNIFFSNIGNQNIFLENNHNPPPPPPWKLNGPSPRSSCSTCCICPVTRCYKSGDKAYLAIKSLHIII